MSVCAQAPGRIDGVLFYYSLGMLIMNRSASLVMRAALSSLPNWHAASRPRRGLRRRPGAIEKSLGGVLWTAGRGLSGLLGHFLNREAPMSAATKRALIGAIRAQ